MDVRFYRTVLLLLLIACVAPLAQAEEPFPWKDGERVRFVFAVDAPTSTYGMVARAVKARYPERDITYLFERETWGYNNVHTYLKNFEDAIAKGQPTFVVIAVSPVDLWPLYRSTSKEDMSVAPWELDQLKENTDGEKRFARDLEEMVRKIQALPARVALVTLPDIANFPLHERLLVDALNDSVRAVAAQHPDVLLVDVSWDFRFLMDRGRARAKPGRFHKGSNQVYPAEVGEVALAYSFLSRIRFAGMGSQELMGLIPRMVDEAEVQPPIVQEMVVVPAGPFFSGVPKSAQPVEVPAFAIDKYEVTNAMYQQFVAATGHAPPAHWAKDSMDVKTRANYPVTNVSRADAEAYAKWAGKRLPTALEWEKAARGSADKRRYPWGDTFDATCANTWESGYRRATPVGFFPKGASPYGAQDMTGNVFEWTATADPGTADMTIVMGGSWQIEATFGDALDEMYAPCHVRSKARPDAKTAELGFRCAK